MTNCTKCSAKFRQKDKKTRALDEQMGDKNTHYIAFQFSIEGKYMKDKKDREFALCGDCLWAKQQALYGIE